MRDQDRKSLRRLSGLVVAAGLVAMAAGLAIRAQEGRDVDKSPASIRAERRAYDGAPPVIPHEDFGDDCTACHDRQGVELDGVGFAPPSPHEETGGMSAISRCRQCHVFSTTTETFVANDFAGHRQDLRRGRRFSDFSPPVIPHKTFMRENCSACHTGVAAREEIRTPHPERVRCRQCHVPAVTKATFSRSGD
jgi:cytochrome c-type protein NapB